MLVILKGSRPSINIEYQSLVGKVNHLASLQPDFTEKILTFILTHILSIAFYSDAGISLRSGHGLLPYLDTEIPISPVVALYSKAVPLQGRNLKWKKSGALHKACLPSTAYCIQLLAKTSSFLYQHPEYQDGRYGADLPQAFAKLADLQLLYCLENWDKFSGQRLPYAPLLEACIDVMNLPPAMNDRDREPYTKWAAKLYDRMVNSINLSTDSTAKLCAVLNCMAKYHGAEGTENLSVEMAQVALEITCRQNRYGLIQNSPYYGHTLPMSLQFEAIDALLSAFPYVSFEPVAEQAFEIFNHVYQLGWNDFIQSFSFYDKPTIQYSASDTGMVIRSLYRISEWIEGEEDQRNLIGIIHQSYLYPILDAYFERFQEPIEALARGRYLKQKSLEWAPVFPRRLAFRFPGPLVEWEQGPVIALREPLILCSRLLDVLERDMAHGQEEAQGDLLGLLLKLLS